MENIIEINKEVAFSRLRDEIVSYAQSRKNDVERGAETPQLSALLLEKFGSGIAFTLRRLDIRSKDLDSLQGLIDELCLEIDPHFEENRKKRYEARPASLMFNVY